MPGGIDRSDSEPRAGRPTGSSFPNIRAPREGLRNRLPRGRLWAVLGAVALLIILVTRAWTVWWG